MAFFLNIDETISMELEYEALLDKKIVYLKKEAVRPQKIGLGIDIVQKIVDLSGEISQIVERFGDGSVVLNKKFQLSGVIYLQLSTCGNGMSIDIRRYCLINGDLIPMRVGVNINTNVFHPLMNGFVEMLQEAESMVDTS